MNENEIKVMLDTLSEYQARRDLMEADKRALLEEVKIPEEVQAIVSDGMKRMGDARSKLDPYLAELTQSTAEKTAAIHATAQVKLATIVIPDEIKAALAEIDRQRAIVTEQRTKDINFLNATLEQVKSLTLEKINAAQMAIQAETEAATKGVYAAIAQRKADIEAEFSGKAEAVDENIRKLTEEIKAEIKALGASVKGDHYQAVYVRGRVTWDTSKMDGYAVGHPEVLFMRKEGDPSVTIRRV